MANQEVVYYQEGNVTITSSRIILGEKTFAMSNITSVSMYEIAPSLGVPFIIALMGGAIALFTYTRANPINVGVITGLLVIVLAGFLLFRAKPSYAVRVGSASGEANALTSQNKEYIQKIISAVNEAIVKRG